VYRGTLAQLSVVPSAAARRDGSSLALSEARDEYPRSISRSPKLLNSRTAVGILGVASLYLAAGGAYGIYARWNRGGFPLAASIFAALFFGLCATVYARRFGKLS
jgi:hypothetical protein